MHGQEVESRRKQRRHMLPSSDTAVNSLLFLSQRQVFFCKDGRRIGIGDCALFQAEGSPPFIGIIRFVASGNDNHPRLGVNWLYRPTDVKLSKRLLVDAAPNEVFYSFHKDEISAAFLLHPCKVAFLPKGVELPPQISSFVCWRVYDIANKCLWWLTDKDYINEWQEEVDKLLDKTRIEMHAEGRSPRQLNAPASSPQLKTGSDSVPNSVTSFPSQINKVKKRDRGDQSLEQPLKREKLLKSDDGDFGSFKPENMIRLEVSKIVDKEGGLVSLEGVEKLINLMQLDRPEKKIDFGVRIMLADVVAATDRVDCLGKFVQLRGLPVLDDWLQEAHKGKAGDGTSPKESDKGVEELLLALLRALDKLPVNLNALQSCNIGKSVNNLRQHKNLEIHKKARSLVDTWKKRVDAEMKSNETKSGSNPAVSWPGKTGLSETPHAGSKRASSSDSLKSPTSQQSVVKVTSSKPGHGDPSFKSAAASPGFKSSLPSPLSTGLKDSNSRVAGCSGASDALLMTIKEEKSSSSSQSQNNSQSCSSDHVKVVGSAWKEDARSSTAGSVNAKTSGSSSRHRKSSNGFMGSAVFGINRESGGGKTGSANRNAASDKLAQSAVTCDRVSDAALGDHGTSQRLIVRLPNRSPAQSISGGSSEEMNIIGGRASSPGPSDKHEPADRKVKVKSDALRSSLIPEVNNDSWHSNDVKDGSNGSDEGDRSPTMAFGEEGARNGDAIGKALDTPKSSSNTSENEKRFYMPESKSEKTYDNSFSSIHALIESCVKYSEVPVSLSGGDDLGMNLLASVAAGEMSKSELSSPVASPERSSVLEVLKVEKDSKCRSARDNMGIHDSGKPSGNNKDSVKHENDVASKPKEVLDATDVACVSSERSEKLGFGEMHAVVDFAAKPDVRPTSDVSLAESGGAMTSKSAEARQTEEHKFTTERRKASHIIDDVGTKKKPKSPSSERVSLDPIRERSADCFASISEQAQQSFQMVESSVNQAERKEAERPSNVSLDLDGTKSKSLHVQVGDETSNGEKGPGVTSHGENVNASVGEISAPGSDPVMHPNDVTVSEKLEGLKAKPGTSMDSNENLEVASNQVATNEDNKEELKAGESEVLEGVEAMKTDVTEKKVFDELLMGSEKDLNATVQGKDVPEKPVAAKPEESSLPSEDCASSVDPSSKLDFDLNEGFPVDDGNQDDVVLASTTSASTPTIHQRSPMPFSVASSSAGVSSPIAVAAAAKGPFVLPENVIRNKGDVCWKSAATSAFRRTEPRARIDPQPLSAEATASDTSVKQGRAPLNIDLNEPDDRTMDEAGAQSSVMRSGDEMLGSAPSSRIGGRLDFDLNQSEEGLENGQIVGTSLQRSEILLMPTRPSSSSKGLPNGEMHAPRDFDLNNGPGLEEVFSEPSHRFSSTKSNPPYLPPVSNLRMNADFGSLSSWLPPASYPQVAIPPFVSDRPEQSYSIVATAPGAQHILGSAVAGPQAFGAEMYRAPVFSSSPAVAFTAAAAFPYAGFPFGGGFPLASTSFSGVSTYMDSSSGGASCFPAIPSQLVGPTSAVSAPYGRSYLISLPEGPSGSETNRKWMRPGLDLNAGPGSVDAEGRDERLNAMRQISFPNSQALAEEQVRMYQAAAGASIKRKEPEGGWDADRFGYKQPTWQ